jgi:predicted nuclease with TOPRIM domain
MSVTVITDQEGEAPQVLTENPDGSPVELVPAEAVEEITDTAVEIAQIEADTAIAIAETHAAVDIARIEADTEARQDYTEWQNRLTSMEQENNLLRDQVSTLQTDLEATRALLETPLEVLPSETDLATLEAETLSSTQNDISDDTKSTQTGPIDVKDSAEEVAVSVPLVSVRKPIFKLV